MSKVNKVIDNNIPIFFNINDVFTFVAFQNPMIIKNYEFKCDKCDKQMKLKHIVWFVKHYKYCGIDEFKVSFFYLIFKS